MSRYAKIESERLLNIRLNQKNVYQYERFWMYFFYNITTNDFLAWYYVIIHIEKDKREKYCDKYKHYF